MGFEDVAVSPLQPPPVSPAEGAAGASSVGRGNKRAAPSDEPDRGLDDVLLSPPTRQAQQANEGNAVPATPGGASAAAATAPSLGHGRGRHTRTADMGKRRTWETVVRDHMSSLPRLLTTSSSCSPSCRGCDTASWATLAVLLTCASSSFGEGVYDVQWQEPYDWDQVRRKLIPNHTATANWFQLLVGMKLVNHATGSLQIDYRVQGRPVCRGTWEQFHGVPAKTMDTIVRLVERGEVAWNTKSRAEARDFHRHEGATLRTAAEQWWYIRLDYYEVIVHSSKGRGVIQHPHNVDWHVVYDTEFVPEMRTIGYDWRDLAKQNGSVGSIATWYAGRTAALATLAKDRIGPDAPPFKFQSRAKHSAYVSDPPPTQTPHTA